MVRKLTLRRIFFTVARHWNSILSQSTKASERCRPIHSPIAGETDNTIAHKRSTKSDIHRSSPPRHAIIGSRKKFFMSHDDDPDNITISPTCYGM